MYDRPTDADAENASYSSAGFSRAFDGDEDAVADGLTDSEKQLGLLSHIGPLAVALLSGGGGGFVVPLIVLFHKNDQKEWVKNHAKESLNFHLTFLLFAMILVGMSFATFGLGLFVALPLLCIMWVGEIVVGIIAALAASRGETYSYPLTIRFIK